MVSGVSAMAVAAGFAVTVGSGVAGAGSPPPPTVTWTDMRSNFTRTISNVNPRPGDAITSTTKFTRTGIPVEYIYEVKDVHPACLTFVSAKVGGKSYGLDSKGDDWAKVKGNAIKWPVYPYISPKSRTFEFSYKVGTHCDLNVPLMTSMSYKGPVGSGTYKNKGPVVTVGLDTSTTAIVAVPSDVQVGQSVPLTATVTGGAAGDNVEFHDGATKIGAAQLNGSRVATFDWTPDTAGAHTLSAKYVGNAQTRGSQSSVTVQVSDVVTTTTLTGPATAVTGTEVTFEAQVSPTPDGGTMQFKDGATDLGAAVPVNTEGKASITHTFDSEGTYDITAVYSGTQNYSGSTSQAGTVTVTDEGGGTEEPGTTGSVGNIFGS
ncbi:Ig-like domain-containing protein [Rhodococcus marinonascens]|uniref:Ig-like domain-containing protein n=1 Tax=Rhodococcus marinonascens TaxID=38311 RepID=UPI00093484D5|nr:Ig-like domain-containing protein [Rhodococcus marinonascens]